MRRYGHLDTGDQCNDDQQNLQKYSMYISSPYWKYNKTYYQRINKFIRIIFFLSVLIDESLESVPTSPLDPNWGKGLPAPTTVVAAPFTPMWRPWEEEENVVVHLSAEVQKRKRRSPAAEARSRQRLLQWQQKRDRHRLQLESRNTPHRSIETSKTWTRLTKRLENEHILNICKGGGAESGAGGGGAAGKTVLYCDQTKTILHPQLLQSPLSSFPPVTSSSSGTSDSRWQAGCSNCLKNMQSLPC